jgi:hypothetical protein
VVMTCSILTTLEFIRTKMPKYGLKLLRYMNFKNFLLETKIFRKKIFIGYTNFSTF